MFGGDKRTPYAEDDLPHPLQVYGITRLAGEHAALATAPRHAIVVRTCGLYGKSGREVEGRQLRRRPRRRRPRRQDHRDGGGADRRPDVDPRSEPRGARARRASGCEAGHLSLGERGQCTWYELTKAIVEILQLPAHVVPVDRGGVTGDMRRPLYSVLVNTGARALGIVLPPVARCAGPVPSRTSTTAAGCRGRDSRAAGCQGSRPKQSARLGERHLDTPPVRAAQSSRSIRDKNQVFQAPK